MKSDLRIVTWNCNGAFRKKLDFLQEFDADIIVIQECENPSEAKEIKYKSWAKNYLWVGENKNKGLGIFAKQNIHIEPLNWENGNTKYFIPCRINNEFNLLAAWCHGANSPTFGYIGQLWKYLQLNKFNLEKSIIAGDFNSNVIWDKWDRWWNHSDVVRELEELNISSVYHSKYNEQPGCEQNPTFFLQRNLSKPYHIDYFFASSEFHTRILQFEIGTANKWLGISDHMPILMVVDMKGYT
ncbi:endonuclease/exonuclease/phosphatase family protein [Solitalea koreensis]|uniref:Exonuclease III n=1 Tax=Solitalea koreensis TaxID=543615 RepID=A0A521BZT7_9SPHI|nr:endonuclease/exonuclease/phosphatase family protein [Solitalea koreensis]SMO52615.1 Exonuclease III [Solitalea koreensis]